MKMTVRVEKKFKEEDDGDATSKVRGLDNRL